MQTGELYSKDPSLPKRKITKDLFYEKLQLWRDFGKIEFAAEVVAAAISLGTEAEAIEAAEFIISESSHTTSTISNLARDVLLRAKEFQASEITITMHDEIAPVAIYKRIHQLKRLLVEYPRNALMWSDLSLSYVKLGQLQQSKDAMVVALNLAPENRFVLRSATRMFIHIDEPDRAHKLLISRSITRHDPWLIAAEIATAGVENRFPVLVKPGRDILNGGKYSAFQTAELASALGTLELDLGATKKARKLFQTSLLDPTENSVAQSIWAKKHLPTLDRDSVLINTPWTFEAQAMEALRDLKWIEAIEKSKLWLADELFSSRPAEVGSYAALIGTEDYPLAEHLLNSALIANPNDLTLINNLAFAIACQGRIFEAQKILDEAILRIDQAYEDVAIKATLGLTNSVQVNLMRVKLFISKRSQWHKKLGKVEQAALASIYYAREMLLAGLMKKDDAIYFAEIAAKTCPYPHINWLLEKLRNLAIGND